MSFGLSTGDIESALSIARNLSQISELNQAGDQSLAKILQRLAAILSKLQELKPPSSTSQVRHYALVEVSSQCQTSLDRFVEARHLPIHPKAQLKRRGSFTCREMPSKQPWESNWSRKALTNFRAEITGHVISLLLLDDLKEDSPREHETFRALVTLDEFCLNDVQRMKKPVEQAVCAFDRYNSLVDRTMRIISTNLRIYNAVIELQQNAIKVPAQVELQAPVILEDALGRPAAFHLDFVTSSKALHEVLMLRFNNEQPLQGLIEKNDFILSSERHSRHIDLEQPWSACFFPGEKVYMSVLLQFHKKCLLCGSKIRLRHQERIPCKSCSTYYQPLSSPLQSPDLIHEDASFWGYATQIKLEDLPPLPLQEFIIKFLSEEFTKFPEFEIWGPSSVRRWQAPEFYRIFSELLHRFASELFLLASNEFQRKVVGTVMSRHRAITSSFKALVLKGGYSHSPSGQSAERSCACPSPDPIVEQLNEDVPDRHHNSESHHHNFNHTHADNEFQYSTDTRLTADEVMVISFLTSRIALANLGRHARQSLYFDSDPQAKFWAVDSKIMEGFRAQNNFKIGKKDDKISATFKVFWELWQFSQEELDGDSKLGPVMTLSGSAIYACATQCENYLIENWSRLGLEILHVIEGALSSDGLRSPGNVSAFSSLQITMELHPKLRPNTKEYAIIEVVGDLDSIKQVGYCLTWLTAAVRVSPFNHMSYSDASFTDCTHLAPFSSKPEFQSSMYFEIAAQDLQELSKEERQMCWNPLFPHSVIADGFPIPKRSSAPGLEISFDVMTKLSGVSYPINYSEGLVLQGLTTMLVPTKLQKEDGLQWHFLAKPKGSRMTLREVDTNCQQWYRTQDIVCLQKPRAFLGWSKEANIYLGTRDINYAGLKCTKTMSPQRKIELSGFGLGVSSGGMGYGGPSGTVSFTVGKRQRNEFCQQKDQDMEVALRTAQMIPLILYDPEEQRGWLVSALSVILHLAHIYAHAQPELVTLHNQRVELPYAEPSSDGGQAALNAILGNHALEIHKSAIGNKSHCFMDLIKRLYFSLMAVMESNSSREIPQKPFWQSQPVLLGWELMGVVSDPQSPQPKEHKLMATSGGWANFASHVLVLFGDGMGDIIRPCAGQNRLCEKWSTAPKLKDYLTANLSMLKVVGEKCGYGESCYKLSDSIQWVQSEDLFPDCRHLSHKKCHGPLQKLKKLTGSGRKRQFRGHLANKPPGAAVIFGRPTSKLPKVKVLFFRGSDDEEYVPNTLPGNNKLLSPSLHSRRPDSGSSTGDIESEDPDSAEEEEQLMTTATTPMDDVDPAATSFPPEPQRPAPPIPQPNLVRDAVPEIQEHWCIQLLRKYGSLLRIGLVNIFASLVICYFTVVFTQGKLLKGPNYDCTSNI